MVEGCALDTLWPIVHFKNLLPHHAMMVFLLPGSSLCLICTTHVGMHAAHPHKHTHAHLHTQLASSPEALQSGQEESGGQPGPSSQVRAQAWEHTAHCTHTHTTLMWHALTSKHGLLHSHARRRANRAQARRIPERQAHHQAQWQARQRACIQARQQVHQLACQQAHQRLHQRAQGFSPWTPHWPRWTCCRRGCR